MSLLLVDPGTDARFAYTSDWSPYPWLYLTEELASSALGSGTGYPFDDAMTRRQIMSLIWRASEIELDYDYAWDDGGGATSVTRTETLACGWPSGGVSTIARRRNIEDNPPFDFDWVDENFWPDNEFFLYSTQCAHDQSLARHIGYYPFLSIDFGDEDGNLYRALTTTDNGGSTHQGTFTMNAPDVEPFSTTFDLYEDNEFSSFTKFDITITDFLTG